MQFVKCKFRPDDSRAYTYANEGEAVAKGDWVKVSDKSGEGWKRVLVESVTDEVPPFACKPILGLYTAEDAADEAMLGAS